MILGFDSKLLAMTPKVWSIKKEMINFYQNLKLWCIKDTVKITRLGDNICKSYKHENNLHPECIRNSQNFSSRQQFSFLKMGKRFEKLPQRRDMDGKRHKRDVQYY